VASGAPYWYVEPFGSESRNAVEDPLPDRVNTESSPGSDSYVSEPATCPYHSELPSASTRSTASKPPAAAPKTLWSMSLAGAPESSAKVHEPAPAATGNMLARVSRRL